VVDGKRARTRVLSLPAQGSACTITYGTCDAGTDVSESFRLAGMSRKRATLSMYVTRTHPRRSDV